VSSRSGEVGIVVNGGDVNKIMKRVQELLKCGHVDGIDGAYKVGYVVHLIVMKSPFHLFNSYCFDIVWVIVCPIELLIPFGLDVLVQVPTLLHPHLVFLFLICHPLLWLVLVRQVIHHKQQWHMLMQIIWPLELYWYNK
jgi:hypothetical protein